MKVTVFPVDNSAALMDRLETLQARMIESNVRLIVLDSIAALARRVSTIVPQYCNEPLETQHSKTVDRPPVVKITFFKPSNTITGVVFPRAGHVDLFWRRGHGISLSLQHHPYHSM